MNCTQAKIKINNIKLHLHNIIMYRHMYKPYKQTLPSLYGDENTKELGTSVILNSYPPASSIFRDSVANTTEYYIPLLILKVELSISFTLSQNLVSCN